MARLLRMPEVAANATVAVLAEWAVAQDADFAASDTLATVETEKALVEIEADSAGVVLKTLVPAGSEVEVGAPIAVLGNPGERVGDLAALLAELGVAETTDPVRPERRDVPDPVPDPRGAPRPPDRPPPRWRLPPSTPPPRNRALHGRWSERHPYPPGRRPVAASPLARRLAQAAGIPVEEIDGTGPRRRILRRDVERAVEARAQDGPAAATSAPVTASAATPTPAGAASYDVVPHSRLRRLVAARLAESKQQAPHFYLRASVRADRLVSLRAEVNDGAETRVSLNDLVLKAVAAAHVRVPEMNAVWTDDAVHRFHSVDVAVAVATDRGLVTPVLRDVASLSLGAVARQVRDLAGRAREGALRQHELEGGSISVTNLGMYGVEEFAAIINPPHAAILAVGAVREEPVVDDGALAVGQVLRLTLSVDHRPVDGVLAAQWMQVLVDLLEHPARLLAT